MQPQSTSLVSPWQPIDLRRSSSSSPATPAAATVPSIPAPPGPLPPISLHQEHLLPSRNPTPYLILIGSHRRHKITLSPKPPPPRSSPPATPSSPGDPATTGRTALEWRIHPRPRGPARSRQSPATIAGAPAFVRPEEEGGGGDRSNLTSGPPGPTVSDPRTGPRVLSGGVKPQVRLL